MKQPPLMFVVMGMFSLLFLKLFSSQSGRGFFYVFAIKQSMFMTVY